MWMCGGGLKTFVHPNNSYDVIHKGHSMLIVLTVSS